MNKQLEKYFDWKFENSEIDTKPYDDEVGDWTGLWKGNFLIIGHPELDDNGTWFSNGPYFMSGLDMFEMEPNEFYHEMVKYVNERYPDIRTIRIY